MSPCPLVIAGRSSVSQHREARTVARTRTREQLHCKASSVQSVSFTAVLLPKRAMPGGVPLTQNLSSHSSERIMVLPFRIRRLWSLKTRCHILSLASHSISVWKTCPDWLTQTVEKHGRVEVRLLPPSWKSDPNQPWGEKGFTCHFTIQSITEDRQEKNSRQEHGTETVD